jgi:hypothetical protein
VLEQWQRIEAFKRYLSKRDETPPHKADTFSLKDRVTFTIAILAFFISATSAYFNVIRRSDDVSLVFRSVLNLGRGPDDEVLLDKRASYPIILINSGSRAAAISEISMLLYQHKVLPDTACEGHEFERTRFDTDFQGVVLKENEVVMRSIKLVPPSDLPAEVVNGNSDSYRLPMLFGLDPLDEYVFEACLEIKLSTPAAAYESPKVQVAVVNSGQGGLYAGDRAKWYPRPLSVISRWGTVFNN